MTRAGAWLLLPAEPRNRAGIGFLTGKARSWLHEGVWMVDEMANNEAAMMAALQDLFDRFEQGEQVNAEQFETLLAELAARYEEAKDLPDDDPQARAVRQLRARAATLEASALEGTGPTDGLSSMLASLTGSDARRDG